MARPMRKETGKSSLELYECGPLHFGGSDAYDRHLVFDHAVALESASQRERFEAVARALRDLLTQRWLLTERTYEQSNAKRVYYLSMEFLLGRMLVNNILNLGVEKLVRDDLRSDPRQDWMEVIDTEPDAGLGNGGLGRLAACFMDSLATLGMPAMGYGLRYEYGIFRQQIQNGYQAESPDHWLSQPDPWEVPRPRETVQIALGCSFHLENGTLRASPTGLPTCWVSLMTARQLAMVAVTSTHCGFGQRLRPNSLTSASSVPVISLGPS